MPGIVILMAVFAAYFIIENVYSPYVIMGQSMEPSYHQGEVVMTEPVSEELLKSGAVVIVSREPYKKIIKRIVGVPGDTVMVEGKPYELKPGEYYVLGDNSDASYDSRYFGPVEESDIKGIVAKKIIKKE